MRLFLVLALAVPLSGCTRAFYRNQADRESYHAIDERAHTPCWDVPPFTVDAPPGSRLHDPYDPNHLPLPPDDPYAFKYMTCPYGIHGYRKWHKYGDAPFIEDPSWRDTLPVGADGSLQLTPERSVELGVLHSREYQAALEQVYLSALALTFFRFQFELQWFGTNDTTFTHFGRSETESNTLTTSTAIGFHRTLASGGQLLAEFANTFVFQFAGRDTAVTSSNIIINFLQPLLRGGGRLVTLEPLTAAERNLLYSVRTFAHFRKDFTFNLATRNYLQLLAVEQGIRNFQSNLASLEQNYRLHQALLQQGAVSIVKVDSVFQQLQQARLSLIQSQSSLETQLDLFKDRLGLPPNLPAKLDDSLLNPFQLNTPALTTLQAELDRFLAEYRELDQAPPAVKLVSGARQLQEFYRRTGEQFAQLDREIENWKTKLAEPADDPEVAERERAAREARMKDLAELREEYAALGKRVNELPPAINENTRPASWEALQARTRDVSAVAAQLFVIQTQVRVFLIKLPPVRYKEDEATSYALDHRLDLMNLRAQVTDAWREVQVTANFLEAGLDLRFAADIATKPGGTNPFDFRASASSYSAGVHVDAPLNRLAERNAYRRAQIAYEQSRRQYMALEDQIRRAVRLDLRQLQTEKLNFEISRQSLIAAARQVEQARENLLIQGAADPTATQDTLNALTSVLQAKNQLIASWVSYETTRYQLLLDLEALQVDERGLYVDDDHPADPHHSDAGGEPAGTSPARP